MSERGMSALVRRLMRVQMRVWDTVAWRRMVRLAVMFALLVAILVAVHLYRLSKVVRAESAVVRARIAVVAAPFEGLIATLKVRDGAAVKEGQPLAVMDTSLLQADAQQAEARVLEARHEIASLEASYQRRRKRQAAEQAVAEADLAAAKAGLEAARIKRDAELAAATAEGQEATAELRSSVASLGLAEKGSRPEEVEAARASMRACEENVSLKRATLERAVALHAQGAVSAAYLDEARTELALSEADRDEAAARLAQLEAGSRPEEVDARRAEVGAAEARLARTRAQHELAAAEGSEVDRCASVVAAARARLACVLADAQELKVMEKQIAQAKARLQAAMAAEARARRRLEMATLRASVSGRVFSITVREGQWVEAQQEMLRVVDTGAYWVEAWVRERDAGRVREGTRATITVDKGPGRRLKLDGRVTGIGGISTNRAGASASAPQRQGTVSVWLSCDQIPELVPGMAVSAVLYPRSTTAGP